MVHVCNASTWERETEKSGVKGHPQQCKEFKVRVEDMGPCLINNNDSKEQNVSNKLMKLKQKS